MRLVQVVLCRLGWHTRSKSRTRYRRKGGYQSVCRICDEPMFRDGNGRWRLEEDDEDNIPIAHGSSD